MRLVVDTNLIVSALLLPQSVPGSLVTGWRQGAFVLVSAEIPLEEIAAVTRYPHIQSRIPRGTAGQIVNAIRGLALMIDTLPRVDRSPDPKDNFLLALAQASGADLLVSGDKRDVLSLKRHEGTCIVTAREALALLGRSDRL